MKTKEERKLKRQERRESVNTLTLNAPATAAAAAASVSAVITGWLQSMFNWGLEELPFVLPEEVMNNTKPVVVILAGILGWRIGRIAQKWTYPQVWEPEVRALSSVMPLPPIPGADPDKRVNSEGVWAGDLSTDNELDL